MLRGPSGLVAGPLLAIAVAACSTEGELGRGSFDYECVESEDAACWDGLSPSGVPSAIAVISRFRLDFTPYQPAGVYTIVPASSDRASGAGGELVLLDPGTQAMLARDESDNVVDFVLVYGAEVKDLFVSDSKDAEGAPLSSLEIDQGEMVTFHARPVASNGQTLAGSLDFSWSIEDEGLADLEVDSESSAECTITGQEDGSTDLTLSAAGLEVIFFLKVSGNG
jgi:hypothetical protein